MPQGRLPFQYEVEGGSSRLRKSFDRHVVARNGGQGWTDGQMGKSFVMLNLAGGTDRAAAAEAMGDGTPPRHSAARAATDGRIPYRDTTEDCRNGAHSIGLTRPG